MRESLVDCPADVLETAVLLTSELVTNAIVHGAAPIDVVVSVEGATVRVDVTDVSARMPLLREAGPLDADGRGLLIVGELSTHWSVVTNERGKTVSFTLPWGGPTGDGAAAR